MALQIQQDGICRCRIADIFVSSEHKAHVKVYGGILSYLGAERWILQHHGAVTELLHQAVTSLDSCRFVCG